MEDVTLLDTTFDPEAGINLAAFLQRMEARDALR